MARIKNWDKYEGELWCDTWTWRNRESDELVEVSQHAPLPNPNYQVYMEYADPETVVLPTHQKALDYAREYMRKNT